MSTASIIFLLLQGMLLYAAYHLLREGIGYFIECQDTGGKGLGALGEFFLAIFYSAISLAISVPILYKPIKGLIFSDTPDTKLPYLCMGIVIALFIYNITYFILTIKEARKLKSNYDSVQKYVVEKFNEYSDEYNFTVEVFNNWVKSHMSILDPEIKSSPNFLIDKLLIFNSDRTRFKTVVHSSFKSGYRYWTGYRYLYGIKVNNEWHIIPKYNRDVYLPANNYNLKSSEYTLIQLSAMYWAYNYNELPINKDIEIEGFKNSSNKDLKNFKNISEERQKIAITTLISQFFDKKTKPYYGDSASRYLKDWRLIRDWKYLNRINDRFLKSIS